MENGMYAAVKTDSTVHAVFVDQEALEFGQLNKMVKANRRQREKERNEQIAAADKVWRAEEARKRKFRRITARTVKQELGLATAMAVVYHGFSVGLVSEIFAVPVLAILLALFCFKAGNFFGRNLRWR